MSKNLTGINAKDYERIGNRISLPQTHETVKRQLDDSFHNIERELNREGHTGKLSTTDGLIHLKPISYKGFNVEVYGRVTQKTRFDVYGSLMWIGTATGEVVIKGQPSKITFDIENSFKNGIEETDSAYKFLFGLIDSFRLNKN